MSCWRIGFVISDVKEAREQVAKATVLSAGQGRAGSLGGLGVRFMVTGAQSGGGFSLLEQPLAPRALAAPLHRHSREDEYSFVLSGRIGALLGDEVVFGEPGDLIFKPRGQWHTYWNAIDAESRMLEIISPAGFEGYFDELIALFAGGRADPETRAGVAARYGLELDLSSIPRLVAEYGVKFG
jgi:quercetin dioxygenase-like cupin family protein